MELIIKKDRFAVYENKKNKIFKIIFKNQSYSLINSLMKTHLIPNSYTDEDYTTLTFKAHSVKMLKKYQDEYVEKHGKKNMLVSDVAKVIRSLTKQLKYIIEKEYCTIIGYTEDEIIVINDEKFAFLGSELIANLDSNSYEDQHEDLEDLDSDLNLNPIFATINCPFNSNDFFFSPEIVRLKEIPARVHYKIAYFSLACLLISLLLGTHEFYNEYLIHKQSTYILNQLDRHPVKDTKIYWLLSRCLVEEPYNRSIILI